MTVPRTPNADSSTRQTVVSVVDRIGVAITPSSTCFGSQFATAPMALPTTTGVIRAQVWIICAVSMHEGTVEPHGYSCTRKPPPERAPKPVRHQVTTHPADPTQSPYASAIASAGLWGGRCPMPEASPGHYSARWRSENGPHGPVAGICRA